MPKRVWYRFKNQPLYFILNAVAAIVFGILFYFVYTQGQRIDDQASKAQTYATQSRDLSIQNHQLTIRIQNQRRDLTYSNCKDQNKRHKNAVSSLYKLLTTAGVPSTRLKKSAEPIIGLITALAPHRNCVKVANHSVPKSITKPKP